MERMITIPVAQTAPGEQFVLPQIIPRCYFYLCVRMMLISFHEPNEEIGGRSQVRLEDAQQGFPFLRDPLP